MLGPLAVPTGMHSAGRKMLTDFVVYGNTHLFVNLSANGPWSGLWQILAGLALGGVVLVLILAIIEPGPLVKRRPFPRKQRSGRSKSDGVCRTSAEQATLSARIEGNPDRNDDG